MLIELIEDRADAGHEVVGSSVHRKWYEVVDLESAGREVAFDHRCPRT